MDYSARSDLQYRMSKDQNEGPWQPHFTGFTERVRGHFYTLDQNGNYSYHPFPTQQNTERVYLTSPLSDKDRYEEAQHVWAEVFHYNAYTNFIQINYLLNKACISSDDFLQNPRLLSDRVTEEDIEQDTSHASTQTWSRQAGRCGSTPRGILARCL